MGMTLILTANDPQASSYTVLAGAGLDVWTLMQANWGNTVWDTQYTGSRGTLGARATSATVANRQVTLALRSLRHASVQAASSDLAALTLVVDRMRKYGGRITYKPSGRSYRQHLEVCAGALGMADWTNQAEHRARYEVTMGFVCYPYVLGDPMSVEDRFLTDTEADYTFDSGSAGNVTISSGRATSSATGTTHYAVHTGVGYLYGDHQAMVRVVPATIANHGGGALIKRVSGGTMLRAVVFDDGASSVLYLDQVNSNSVSNLTSTALTRIAAGLPYHVAVRIEGNTVYAEYWAPSNPPSLGGVATNSVSSVLTSTALTTFGEGTVGQAGWVLYPASANDAIEHLRIDPYVYRGSNFTGWSAPDEFRLEGDIPGDAPALCEVQVAGEGVSGDYTRFGMLGWSRRPAVHNLIPDGGDFEMGTTGSWWSVLAVSGVTGAATSQTRTAGGRFGGFCNQIVCPATANTGVSCVMYRRFRAGVTYTAEAWVRGVSASPNFRIRLGVSGDIGSASAFTLGTGWSRITTTWTPTATVTAAYFAGEITTATASTWQIDGVRVYEGTTAPSLPSQVQGYGGRPPFGIVDAGEAYLTGSVALTTGASTTNYLRGRYLDWPTTADGAAWVIDPSLIPRDDLAAGLDVEVWAFGQFEAGDTLVTAIRTYGTTSGSQPSKATGLVWTREYGSNGYTVPTGGLYGWMRLGTVPLDPVENGLVADIPVPVMLQVHINSNSTNTQVNCLALLPSRSRAVGPTSKTDDTDYPRFSVATDAFHRRFLPDLRGLYGGAGTTRWRIGPGLGGSLLEVDPGPVDFVLGASQYIPGTTSSSVSKFRQTAALQVTPIPRWHQLRDK